MQGYYQPDNSNTYIKFISKGKHERIEEKQEL